MQKWIIKVKFQFCLKNTAKNNERLNLSIAVHDQLKLRIFDNKFYDC